MELVRQIGKERTSAVMMRTVAIKGKGETLPLCWRKFGMGLIVLHSHGGVMFGFVLNSSHESVNKRGCSRGPVRCPLPSTRLSFLRYPSLQLSMGV